MADSLESESAEVLLSIKNAGSHPAKSPPPPVSRRGYPSRIRKRNRLFFNDDEESYSPSKSAPRKHPKLSSPQKRPVPNSSDVKASQTIYQRLRNLLKLPKAHKWVCYEFFYSNLDKSLFGGDNDFSLFLNDAFPNLKTRNLTRVEWCKIRRLMGKPRRCSAAFFIEERNALHGKRGKIRQLQQRKAVDLALFKDLPEEIPLPLVIGTKVTARIRDPQDGLFTGSIDAVDTSNATYRVTFEKQGLGTHSIPDYEVLSNELQDTMPLSSFAQKHRTRSNFYAPPRFIASNNSPQMEIDPVLGSSPMKSRLVDMEDGTLGGFPVKFLVSVVRLTKILNIKKEKIKELREMNSKAERTRSYQHPITLDFQQRYAAIILELERLNRDLNEHLADVQRFCQEIAPDQGFTPGMRSVIVREKCDEESMKMVEKMNRRGHSRRPVTQNPKLLSLIAGFTSLMLQIKSLGDSDLNSFELKSLNDSLNDIKKQLDQRNIGVFQNNVEIHVNHIQSGMSQMGNLYAFAASQGTSL